MLKKRVIFTLLYDQGAFMLSRNFRLQKVGDLRWLQKNYNFSNVSFSIDELVILDVSRTVRDTDRFCEHVKAMTEGCFVPIAAGGGVTGIEHAQKLLRAGADKVVVNTAIAADSELVREMATLYGRQCIVASVDAKQTADGFEVFTNNGGLAAGVSLSDWMARLAELPVGEIYLNSMDRDGTGQGYLLAMLDYVPATIATPVILAGGAGKPQHLAEGLLDPRVDAVATAHLFNCVGDGLNQARLQLLEAGQMLPWWDRDRAKALAGTFSG